MPWANQTLHDSIIFRDNDFEIFINANGDNYNYNEIEINALGKVWDLFLPSPYRDMGKLHTAPLMNWETIAPSQPTESQLPTGWTPMQQAIWMNGTINNGTVPSVGWGLEVALPWTIIAQASESAPRYIPYLVNLLSHFLLPSNSSVHNKKPCFLHRADSSDANWHGTQTWRPVEDQLLALPVERDLGPCDAAICQAGPRRRRAGLGLEPSVAGSDASSRALGLHAGEAWPVCV